MQLNSQMKTLISIMYQAKMTPCGLLVRTGNAHQTRQKFYLARDKANDPELANLQFRFSPEDPNLIAITKGAPAGEAEAEAEAPLPELPDELK